MVQKKIVGAKKCWFQKDVGMHIALYLLFTPHLTLNLTDLYSYQQSSSSCPSLEKILALLHPLDDHLTVHVAHPN